jgi:hypothetical protein
VPVLFAFRREDCAALVETFTFCTDMRKDHPHCPAVKDSLDEAVAALIRDPYKWGDACEQACRTKKAGIIDTQGGMLQVDE